MGAKFLSLSFVVTEDKLAEAMGSGDMPVLATPAMVAMMENTAMKLAAGGLADGESTVGSYIETSHLRPSALGATIVVEATLDEVEGRKLSFSVKAKDGDNVIGEGKHVRYVVNRERFLSKIK